MDFESKLIDILERNGVEIQENHLELESIALVTSIVDIEEEFGIEFPDDLLSFEVFSDFYNLKDTVSKIIDQNG